MLILGMRSNSYSYVQVLRDSSRYSLAALDCLEAPVIAPLTKPAAGIDTDAFHPGVNCSQARLAIEIEYYVRVGDVYLIFHDYAIGAL
jgi:hypothetical protein